MIPRAFALHLAVAIGGATLGAALTGAVTTAAQAQNETQSAAVEIYATCLLDGVGYELGQVQNDFGSTVVRRTGTTAEPETGTGAWGDLGMMRYGWLYHSPLVTAVWQDGARHMAVAYRPGVSGETDARFGWIKMDLTTLASGHGDGVCTIVKEHSTTSTLVQQEFDTQAGDTVLSTCRFDGMTLTFSTNADEDYRQFGQINEDIGKAKSLDRYIARDSLRRSFAFDDGLATYLLAHQPDGTAVVAFTLLSEATLGSGAGTGTCEVFP